jgi:hypothetical protein
MHSCGPCKPHKAQKYQKRDDRMDTIVKETAATAVSAKSATTTGAIFGATPRMPAMFKSNFDYQLVRGMCAGAYGEGGAFGELYSTARRVVDKDKAGRSNGAAPRRGSRP